MRRKQVAASYAMIVILFSFCSLHVQAQDSTRNTGNPSTVRIAYQRLRSTHATIFNGASAECNADLSPHFAIGLGIQYAGTKLHNDNGWVLTNLKFLPVYTSQVYTFLPAHHLQPFIHAEEGISFNHYNKLDTTASPVPSKVSEEGLYLSGNAGVNLVLLKHLTFFTELGYKGYKHSANVLDVNPHGLTARFGIAL